MKLRIDTHTHSVASGHAYSTVDELARGAKKRGLAGFVLTDHGPALPGGTHKYHFGNLRILPKTIHGVRFYTGVEANIMDLDGSVDLDAYYLGRLDFVMAGFHELCFAPRSMEENTRALIAAIANPAVDAISHPGNPTFPVDYREVVAAAVEYGKALELNDSSFRIRSGSAPNCATLAALCAESGSLVVCGSDAHYWADVGRFDNVLGLLRDQEVPKSLVLNASIQAFERFAAERRAARAALVGRA